MNWWQLTDQWSIEHFVEFSTEMVILNPVAECRSDKDDNMQMWGFVDHQKGLPSP